MEKVFQTIKQAFENKSVRNRIYFTLFILMLYRLGCMVLVPGIDAKAFAQQFDFANNNLLNMVNTFTGGALGNAAVFALGIMPYITASIIVQILQKSIPTLERLSKEGERGRQKLNRYTRYLTVAFGLLHSYGITTLLLNMDRGSQNIITIENSLFFRITVMTTLTTGAIIIMWLGEKITENGIGNGISLIIFASIVARIPAAFQDLYQKLVSGTISGQVMLVVLAVILGTVMFVVFFEMGTRKLTIQFATRAVQGGGMQGGVSKLPFKVNSAGVIPVIFSASIVQFPNMIEGLLNVDPNGMAGQILAHFHYGRPFNTLVFAVATLFFTFFYVEMMFTPKDIAENLKKQGGHIPNITPGKKTEKYIEGVIKRLTFWGGIYLCAVSIIPNWIMFGLQLNTLPRWLGGDLFEKFLPDLVNAGTGVQLAATLGGTSLLIVISVAIDFIRQVKSQLQTSEYGTGKPGGSGRRYA
jgi:preprotein translocase subunit SecY